MVKRIKALCEERGTNFAALEKRLGMGNATLKKANEKMQAVRLKSLADYFGVSMEYLLTGSDKPQNVLSKQEHKLLQLFNNLNAQGQAEALRALGNLSLAPVYTDKRGQSLDSKEVS